MTERELKLRTKAFALRIPKLTDSLPDTRSGRILASQLGRSGTSVGANYRAAGRSRSQAEMISKLAVVAEEADESCFWMELITEHGTMQSDKLAPLLREADGLTAIMAASRRTLAVKNPKSRIQNPKST